VVEAPLDQQLGQELEGNVAAASHLGCNGTPTSGLAG
jgi:hypothetical protein